jgi:hypothetical protein
MPCGLVSVKNSKIVFPVIGFVALVLVAGQAIHAAQLHGKNIPDWAQWARTPQHTDATSAAGLNPRKQLADVTFDPFVNQEQAESKGGAKGDLLVHYQVPLVDGNQAFLEYKTGTYDSCHPPGSGHPYPCGPDAWDTQIWNERAFVWTNGSLVESWNFQSDWKPEPNSGAHGKGQGLYGWEPVFHAAISNGFVFVPGFSGSIYKLKESDGTQVAQYTPFGTDANAFVSGPLTVDNSGNLYYTAVALDPTNPWTVDVRGAYLVKLTPQGVVKQVSFSSLVQGSPDCGDAARYGSQRPGINVAPAVSADGKTIYTLSRAHFDPAHACLLAANANLTSQWHSSLITSEFAGSVTDNSSSTPAVATDGSILYGAANNNDDGRGYLMKFSASGNYLTSYDFGWDETPAIYAHDGTYSVIIKDNNYGKGPYYITQLNANLEIEWQFKSPTNHEWCVNAPAVDSNGSVYADSEDGNLYVVKQGGTLQGKIFLKRALGAAYTPIAIGRDGKLYTENDGDMFALGR